MPLRSSADDATPDPHRPRADALAAGAAAPAGAPARCSAAAGGRPPRRAAGAVLAVAVHRAARAPRRLRRRRPRRALQRGTVVKSTLMRGTLHLVHADAYPAYAAAWRFQALRMLAGREPELAADHERIVAALADFLREPRSDRRDPRAHARADRRPPAAGERPARLRAHVAAARARAAVGAAAPPRQVLARAVGRARCCPIRRAGTVALVRDYLAAFGPATREDLAAFSLPALPSARSGAGRARAAAAADRRPRRELLDLPRAPLPREDVTPPVRFLPKWDAALISHRDRTPDPAGRLPRRRQGRQERRGRADLPRRRAGRRHLARRAARRDGDAHAAAADRRARRARPGGGGAAAAGAAAPGAPRREVALG